MRCTEKLWKQLVLFLVNCFLRGTHFFGAKWWLLNSCSGITIGKSTRIVTPIFIPAMSQLTIGCNCWIGRNFTIEGNGAVHIGDNCDLAPSVFFLTGSHTIGDSTHRAGEGYNGEIHVGDGTWIGSRSIIVPNVSINNGNVIGAGALVIRDTRPNTLNAGVPAKEIKVLE